MMTLTSQDVAFAAGVETKQVQNWATRNLITGHQDDEHSGGKGNARRYSINSVMEIAVAAELIALGLGPEQAFRAAMRFAHVGRGPSGWVGEPVDLRGQRRPGFPYHHNLGRTLLIVTKETARVTLEGEENRRVAERAKIVVDVLAVFSAVCARLQSLTGDERNYHPYAVLDAAYPDDVVANV